MGNPKRKIKRPTPRGRSSRKYFLHGDGTKHGGITDHALLRYIERGLRLDVTSWRTSDMSDYYTLHEAQTKHNLDLDSLREELVPHKLLDRLHLLGTSGKFEHTLTGGRIVVIQGLVVTYVGPNEIEGED